MTHRTARRPRGKGRFRCWGAVAWVAIRAEGRSAGECDWQAGIESTPGRVGRQRILATVMTAAPEGWYSDTRWIHPREVSVMLSGIARFAAVAGVICLGLVSWLVGTGRTPSAEIPPPREAITIVRDIAYRDGASKSWRLDLAMK